MCVKFDVSWGNWNLKLCTESDGKLQKKWFFDHLRTLLCGLYHLRTLHLIWRQLFKKKIYLIFCFAPYLTTVCRKLQNKFFSEKFFFEKLWENGISQWDSCNFSLEFYNFFSKKNSAVLRQFWRIGISKIYIFFETSKFSAIARQVRCIRCLHTIHQNLRNIGKKSLFRYFDAKSGQWSDLLKSRIFSFLNG